jgi:cytochrome P450
VTWEGWTVPPKTNVLIYVPFLHRDEERLRYANRFNPDLWLSGGPGDGWPLIPFSEAPRTCPAHRLVPMLGSEMIAALLVLQFENNV